MNTPPIMRPNIELTQIHLHRDPIDFRKAHRGLVAIIELELGHNPFEGHLYAFTNRQYNKIKCIFWETNGFVLYYKSLSEEKFKWPKNSEDIVILTGQQIKWLLDGYNVMNMKQQQKNTQ